MMERKYYGRDGKPCSRYDWLSRLRDEAKSARDHTMSPDYACLCNIEYRNYATLLGELAPSTPPFDTEVTRLQAIETAARAIEWISEPRMGGLWCPECENEQAQGHTLACRFGAALAASEEGE